MTALSGSTVFPSTVAVVAMSSMTATAFASGKPFVETKPATSIWELTAALNGVVNPNGAATKYYFQYGTTTSYGKTTAEVSVGEGTTNLEEAQSGLELAPETTYHFRVVATNTNGTSDGEDATFKTLAKSKGLPEIVPAKLLKFTATLGASHWMLTGDDEVACGSGKATGAVTGAKTLESTITFEGCDAGIEIYPCGNNGSKNSITAPFSITLVYLNKATKELALLYSVPKELNFVCATMDEQMVGSFLVPVPADKETATYTLTAKGKKGVQEPSEYENEAGKKVKVGLTFNGSEPISMQFEQNAKFAKAVEFKG